MKRLPQIALLSDGRRLHLQDGPIDLIVEARGREHDVRAAYEAAAAIKPQDREIGVNRGMTLLRAGRLDAGWDAFEQRKRALDPLEEAGIPTLPILSDDLDLNRKTILNHRLKKYITI